MITGHLIIHLIHSSNFHRYQRNGTNRVDNLHGHLSVLSRAIHYKNLSGAADHVGLSQPQLSRIVSRLEAELGVVLLDRTVRRKSGWTPIAFKIAETYFRNSRKLTQALQQLKTDDHISHVTIGTLDGLIEIATEFCQQLYQKTKVQIIELNAYDLSELEEHFEKDELDLVFTCREPGHHKYKNVRQLGYQIIEKIGPPDGLLALSPFEYSNQMQQRRSQVKDSRVLLSNSLSVRRVWIERCGGTGTVPSEVRPRKTSEQDVPVLLLASDLFSPSVWEKIEQIRL